MSITRQQELGDQRIQVQRRLKEVELELQMLPSGPFNMGMDEIIEPAPLKVKVDNLRRLQKSLMIQAASIDARIEADRARLHRLHYWLTVESIGGVSTIVVAKGSFYLIASLAVPFIWWYSFLIIAALVFAPFMLATIIRARRMGWVLAFVGMVGIPCLLLIIPIHDPYFTLAFQLFPLLMFYAYCALLRHAVEEWLEY